MEARRQRQAREQWPLGTERIPLHSLIEPFRQDVLIRADLMQMIRDRPELTHEELLEAAAAMPYHEWWMAVAIKRHNGLSRLPFMAKRSFEQRVQRTQALVASFEATGPQLTDAPVSVHINPDNNGYGLLDGGHRVAMLVLLGRSHLEPDEHRVGPAQEPIDNAEVCNALTTQTKVPAPREEVPAPKQTA